MVAISEQKLRISTKTYGVLNDLSPLASVTLSPAPPLLTLVLPLFGSPTLQDMPFHWACHSLLHLPASLPPLLSVCLTSELSLHIMFKIISSRLILALFNPPYLCYFFLISQITHCAIHPLQSDHVSWST